MEVYKIMKLEYFKEIVEKKELFFINPFCWTDKTEGYIHSVIKSGVELMSVKNYLEEKSCLKSILTQIKNGYTENDKKIMEEKNNIENDARKDAKEVHDTSLDWFGIRCQSWSRSDDKQKMWDIYGKDAEYVCITVDVNDLIGLTYESSHSEGFFLKYVEDIKDYYNALDEIVEGQGTLYFPKLFQLKDKSFLYEDEYRVWISGIIKNDQGDLQLVKRPNYIRVPIRKPVHIFLKYVNPSPVASDEIKKKLFQYCNSHNINYLEERNIEKGGNQNGNFFSR